MKAESRDILWTLTLQNSNSFSHLQGIADGMSQGLLHGSNGRDRVKSSQAPYVDHRACQFSGLFHIFHECAGSNLHVQQQVRSADRQFLAHDTCSDQWNTFNCARYIAQGIHFAIGRGQVA